MTHLGQVLRQTRRSLDALARGPSKLTAVEEDRGHMATPVGEENPDVRPAASDESLETADD
jgi:hypothetical protein